MRGRGDDDGGGDDGGGGGAGGGQTQARFRGREKKDLLFSLLVQHKCHPDSHHL